MTDAGELKSRLRTDALARRSALRSEVARRAALAACEHFSSNMLIADGAVVALYWPIRDEMDTRPLLSKLIDDGVKVCLPVVQADDRPLLFRIWDGMSNLDVAGFGTMAPGQDAPVATPDIMVLPVAGFDSAGQRLGYGKGFYDRTIAAMRRRPLCIGYGFSAQQVDAIPAEPHDVAMDMMVTEEGVVHFASQEKTV